jgi:hypothetical protein
VTQQGDTLKSIARAEYGNASLWYVVAQANGLQSDDDLAAGQSLSIPQVTTNSNDASTFKPYNPAEIAGSTTPPSVYIPKAPAQQCDALAAIFVLVVEIVVTAYAGPIAGNAAGQLAGDAMGTHEGFSVRELAIAAAASYVGAEVGEGLQGSSAFTQNAGANGLNWYGNAVVGASSYVAGYEAAEMLGEPAHFSVAGLIAASAGSAAAGEIGPTQAQVDTGDESGTFWGRVGANVVQDVVTRETSILLGDHHIQSWQEIVEDVFRNAAVDGIHAGWRAQDEQKLNPAEQKLLDKEHARLSGDIDAQTQGSISGTMDALNLQAGETLSAAIESSMEARSASYAEANVGSAWARATVGTGAGGYSNEPFGTLPAAHSDEAQYARSVGEDHVVELSPVTVRSSAADVQTYRRSKGLTTLKRAISSKPKILRFRGIATRITAGHSVVHFWVWLSWKSR